MAGADGTTNKNAISSMTGFARAENANDNLKCVIEIKSLNHRFQETSLRTPFRDYGVEKKLKEMISKKVTRGYVELSISLSSPNGSSKKLVADDAMIEQFLKGMEKIREKHSLGGEPDLSMLLTLKDAIRFEEEEQNPEERWSLIEAAVEEALGRLLEMRLTEGGSLGRDLLEKLDVIEQCTKQIMGIRDEQAENALGKTREKIEKILGNSAVDPQRLLMEAAIIAERADISEEITRLNSHIEQLRALMKTGGSVGRKAEFIIQEINREANTISSKSTAYDINRQVVEMKSNIEKLREQAANIE